MGSPSTVAMMRSTTSARPVTAAESATTIATAAETSGRPCLMAGDRLSRRSAALQGRTIQRLTDGAYLGDDPVVIGRGRPDGQGRAAGQPQPAVPTAHRLEQGLHRHRGIVVELEHDGVAAPACRRDAQILE